MKLKTLLIAFLSIVCIDLYGQKLETDKAKFYYIQPPLNNLHPECKTYSVNIQNQTDMKLDIKDILFFFRVCDLKRVNENGDVQINITLGKMEVANPKMITTTREQKDANGVMVKTEIFYYETNILSPVYYSVMDNIAKSRLQVDTLNNKFAENFKTEEFTKKADLDAYWSKSSQNFIDLCKNNASKKNVETVSKSISYKNCFNKEYAVFDVASAKKKFDYKDLDEAQENAIKTYKSVKPNIKTQFDINFQKSIQTSIDIWEKALKEHKSNVEDTRINDKIAVGLHTNCAYAYMFTQNWIKSQEHINKANQLKVKYRWLRRIKWYYDDFKKRTIAFNEYTENQADASDMKKPDFPIKDKYDIIWSTILRYRENLISREILKDDYLDAKEILDDHEAKSNGFRRDPKNIRFIDQEKREEIMEVIDNISVGNFHPDLALWMKKVNYYYNKAYEYGKVELAHSFFAEYNSKEVVKEKFSQEEAIEGKKILDTMDKMIAENQKIGKIKEYLEKHLKEKMAHIANVILFGD